jgi:hypothetical protein
MGWEIVKDERDLVGVALGGNHIEYLAFQRSIDYERPTWPNEAGHQQMMMMHLDIEVPDLRRAIAAIATEASFQTPGAPCGSCSTRSVTPSACTSTAAPEDPPAR